MLKTHYLNYRHVSSDPKLIAKAELLAIQYRTAKQQLRRNKRDFALAFNIILTNVEVYQAYDGYCLNIPTDNNLFSGKAKRNATYTTEIRDALRWLITEGYLEKAAGLMRPKKKGSDERLWLPFTYELSKKWLTEIAATPLSDPRLIHRNPLVEYWLLRKTEYVRGKKKKFAIKPTDGQLELNSAMLEATNQTLSAYEDFMATVATTIGSYPVHPSQLSLTRIFSKGSKEVHKNEEDATKTKVMKGIKGVSLDFSDALAAAITQCFEQDTETLTDSYWDTLLAAEEVQECDKVDVDEEVEEL